MELILSFLIGFTGVALVWSFFIPRFNGDNRFGLVILLVIFSFLFVMIRP